MSLKLRLALFVAGAILFWVLLQQLGLQRLTANLRSTGWLLLPIVLLYAVVYACYAGAWHIVLAEEPRRPSFARSYAVSISSIALNYVTPVMQIGGEGFRAAALTPWLGARRATGAVVTYYMLHALSNMLVWLLAVTIALALYVRDPPLVAGFAVLAAALVLMVAFVLSRHRDGFFAHTLALLERLPPTRPLARLLTARKDSLLALDTQIAGFYRRDTRRFFLALALDLFGRCVGVLEFVLIGRGVGLAVGYVPAFVMAGLGGVVINALSFLPFEIGAKEGGFYLIFGLLGLTPALGVSAAIVMRLRELVWITTGLAIIWLSGAGRSAAPSSASAPPAP